MVLFHQAHTQKPLGKYEISGRGILNAVTLYDKKGALKQSWPGSVLCKATTRDARKAAGGNSDTLDHLPLECADMDRQIVRTGRDLSPNNAYVARSHPPRIIMVFRTKPITTIEGCDFIRAWLECVRGKACLSPIGACRVLTSRRPLQTLAARLRTW